MRNAGTAIFTILSVMAVFVVFGRGNVDWSGREPHPAVVNPVCGNEPGSVLDLGGEWEFTTQPYNADRSQFFRMVQYGDGHWKGSIKLTVPGCWENQGVGERVDKPVRSCYGGRIYNFPLKHSFNGDGWYRRKVKVPSEWAGRRIWLKIGGVGCQGWFWVNDMPVAHIFDYCATRKFDITDLVKPGEEAKFVAEISNAAASKLGTSEDTNCWGGFRRGIELESTPEVCIDDAWVRGDFDGQSAEVKVKVEGERWDVRFSLRATVENETKEVPLRSTPTPSDYTLELPLRQFRAWSPEHPNLYTAKVELVENGRVIQTRLERFGVRKIEVRGKDFYLNGKPFFMRGCGFHDIDPINGHHLANREYCRERISMARKAGFNFARLHTRCESPEFFEIADELGLMLQPELPYYGDHVEAMAPFDPLADVTELWENFRRHPSFAVYCAGNEGTLGPVLGPKFYAHVKAMDPDRLVIENDTMGLPFWKRTVLPDDATNADVWCGRKYTKAKDVGSYRVAGYDDFVAYPSTIWPRGSYDPPCPLVAHEYMNISVKSDTRLADRYTGLWDHTVKREDRGLWLARFGLGHDVGDRLHDAQNQLQATWQKLGIEAARKDPCCDGYHFWSLTDCTIANEIGWTGKLDTENPAFMAQGLFTSFMTEKPGGQTAAGFAEFNSPVGIFVDATPTNLQLVAGEPFALDVFVANYGDAPIDGAVVRWTLADASGEKRVGALPLGYNGVVTSLTPVAPEVMRPMATWLTVSVGGFSNRWKAWIFPRRPVRDGVGIAVVGKMRTAFSRAFHDLETDVSRADVVVADYGSEDVSAALGRGQNVIEIGGTDGEPNVQPDWWFLSGIVGAVFETANPVLKHMPESKDLSTLYFRIFRKGLLLPLADFDRDSLIAVSEEGKGCFAHLAERVDINGGRHLLAYGLALDLDCPEAHALLDGLVDAARRPVSAEDRARSRAQEESGKSVPVDSGRKSKSNITETGGAGRL